MRRLLLNALTALSLLLFVAVLVLWTKSYVAGDAATRWTEGPGPSEWQRIDIWSGGGQILVVWDSFVDHKQRGSIWGPTPWQYLAAAPPPINLSSFWPVWVTRSVQPTATPGTSLVQTEYHAISVAHWIIALFLAVLPGRRMTRYLRARRQARLAATECCVTCGYDLRATPDTCPECGTSAPRPAAP